MKTRKEYADQKKVTEKTVRTWVETAGIDPQKTAFTDQEIRLLDYVKSRLDEGKTLAEIAEILREAHATSGRQQQQEVIEPEVIQFVEGLTDNFVESASDIIIARIPFSIVKVLTGKGKRVEEGIRKALQEAEIKRNSMASSPYVPLIEEEGPPPPPAPPQLPESK